jgi:hypothetical protein
MGSSGLGYAQGHRSTASSAETLAAIEDIGWRLEHASYFYMITTETASQGPFRTGDDTAVNGVTIGVYLFRSTSPVSDKAAPAAP